MKIAWAIRCLSAVLVVAGLVLAPMPSAKAHTMAATMEAGMPCCPDGDTGSHDNCKDCAQMVLCALKTFQAMTVISADGFESREPMMRRLELAGAFAIDDLAIPPPARPPRR